MRHLLFPLETPGSFFKFNSFLFIYLFIFLIFNIFICSLQINDTETKKEYLNDYINV